MPEATRTAAPSKAAALAGRVVGALAAVVDAVSEAVREGAIGLVGPAPALRPIPVGARHGRAARRR